MAGDTEIIKEFLVSLGFRIDAKTLGEFDGALGKTTKAAVTFAGVLAGVALTATAFVDRVASKMEDLYWSSVRLRDGAANIQDFQLQLSKFGGTADGALNSLENMARFLRTNPAGEGLLHNLGVQTRDVNGNLRSTIDIVKDFSKLPMPYWLKVRFAERFGIDEKSLQAIIRAAPEAENRVSSLYKRAGIDADKAAKSAQEFKNRLRDTEAIGGVLANTMMTRLLPVVTVFVDLLATAAGWMLDLDRLTGGFSTQLITLTGIIWGVNAALSMTFGTTIARMIAALILQVGLLASALGASEGVVGALVAISAAIEATPIGWIITAIALLTIAAAAVIMNWDKVKAYFNSFVGWLRDKYNAVAKYLGLPQWGSGPAKPGGTGGAGYAGTSGPGRDFRAEERNLGPNSAFGGPTPDLQKKALAFFQKAGWSKEQAAGIVANLVAESGMDAHAVGDNGRAYGVAQWHPDRQRAFREWAGKDIRQSTLDEQLAFVNHELTAGGEKAAGGILRGLKSAAEAGAAVSRYYERPADAAGEARRRGAAAANLVDGARLTGGSGSRTVVLNQKTDIKVSGSGDPDATARAVGRDQGRVNGNLVRDFAGAVQ